MSDTSADDAGLQWADELNPRALRILGGVALELLKRPDRWIHRRVERVFFRDHLAARHQTSVDFTLPSNVAPIAVLDGEAVYAAPLFMVAKSHPGPPPRGAQPDFPRAPYSAIDFRDQHGTSLPLLTRRQSGLIAAVVLRERANEVLGAAHVREDLRTEINDIATLDTIYDRPATKAVLEREVPAADLRMKLRKDPLFRELAYAFSSHSLIVCLFRGRPHRTIVKLVYDEVTNTGVGTQKGRLRRSLGWKSEQYFVALTEIGGCASYHVEIDLPRELELNEIGLVGTRYEDFGRALSKLSRSRQRFYIRQVGKALTGSLYVPRPGDAGVGAAWVKLRARRAGFLVGALVASLITTAVLSLAAIAAPQILSEGNPEGAIAVLLLLPTLLAAYVARPGEHAITSRMLRWARIALVLDGMLPFISALLLLTSTTAAKQATVATPAIAPKRTAGARAPGNHGAAETAAPCARRARRRAGPAPHQRGRAAHHAARNRCAAANEPSRARKQVHRRAFLRTLRGKWTVLAAVSVLFVVLFALGNILPRPHQRSRYVVRARER